MNKSETREALKCAMYVRAGHPDMAARKHAETIDPRDPAHIHWHAVADACHDALDHLDKMQTKKV
jgi:hypothetical protein